MLVAEKFPACQGGEPVRGMMRGTLRRGRAAGSGAGGGPGLRRALRAALSTPGMGDRLGVEVPWRKRWC